MKPFIVILLLGLVPLCTTINCYICASGSEGCNDPLNSIGAGVLTTADISTDTYCMKVKVNGIVMRSATSSCYPVSVNDNTITTCCQQDFCNRARGQYQASILLALSIFVIFIKFKWV